VKEQFWLRDRLYSLFDGQLGDQLYGPLGDPLRGQLYSQLWVQLSEDLEKKR